MSDNELWEQHNKSAKILTCSEPIVELDFVDFPAKVYYNGKIQTMSKEQFKKISGVKI